MDEVPAAAAAPDVRLEPATRAEHALAGRLWQLYQHDLSSSRGTMPDADGRYPQDRLPHYLGGDPDRRAYLVRTDGGPAGFVFVRGLAADGGQPLVMGEFFVVRAVRRRGVGRAAARTALALHPGPWEIPFQEENAGAARFWRAVAADVAGRAWTQELRPVPGRPGRYDTWLGLRSAGAR